MLVSPYFVFYYFFYLFFLVFTYFVFYYSFTVFCFYLYFIPLVFSCIVSFSCICLPCLTREKVRAYLWHFSCILIFFTVFLCFFNYYCLLYSVIISRVYGCMHTKKDNKQQKTMKIKGNLIQF